MSNNVGPHQLSSSGEPVEWSVQLTNMTFGGETTSLVFFCLYLSMTTIGRPIGRRLRRGIKPTPPEPQWLEKLYTPFGWLVRITLPISVILVWNQ
jgi:hypothetical protein